jgi:hypothetical protein
MCACGWFYIVITVSKCTVQTTWNNCRLNWACDRWEIKNLYFMELWLGIETNLKELTHVLLSFKKNLSWLFILEYKCTQI